MHSSNNFWANLKSFADNIALIDTANKQSLTYKELDDESDSISEKIKLPYKGLAFLFTTNKPESVVLYIALLKSGNAVLLLDEKLKEEIRTGLINNYKPDFIISASSISSSGYKNYLEYHSLHFLKKENNDQPNEIFSELSVLLSTSGTTGSPKLVKLAYRNIQSNADSIAEYLNIDENERPITTLPFNYSFGLSIINSHLLKGSAIILTEQTVFFRDFWNLFNEYKCTSFAGVPYTYTMLKRIGFEKLNLPSLNYFTQAGGKLSEEFIKFFNDYAINSNKKFFVMYGQTEATARITYVPAEKLSGKIGSIGISIPGGELKIMNDGIEIPKPNEVGEIVYKLDNVI
ncbi:MAG: AMP-binding protein, partial [Ignavibacteriaceae bacterium]|nr:AMP-binding protein [Ignavibacteriaceae bacterium]